MQKLLLEDSMLTNILMLLTVTENWDKIIIKNNIKNNCMTVLRKYEISECKTKHLLIYFFH